MRRSPLLVLALASLLAASASVAPPLASPATAAEKILSVSRYRQQESQWCWVAASQSIVKYHTGNAYTQCQLFKWGKNSSTCWNEDGSWTNYQNIFRAAGFTNLGTEVTYPVSYSDVRYWINNYRPLIARISWKDGSGKKTGVNHAAPIRGYTDYPDDGSVVHWIYISTTDTGTEYRAWGYLRFKSNSSFDWTVTRYGMDK